MSTKTSYMIEYNHPVDRLCVTFYGSTMRQAAAAAKAHDPAYVFVSTGWWWNGEFYQREPICE